jgi:hypothetical protein
LLSPYSRKAKEKIIYKKIGNKNKKQNILSILTYFNIYNKIRYFANSRHHYKSANKYKNYYNHIFMELLKIHYKKTNVIYNPKTKQ